MALPRSFVGTSVCPSVHASCVRKVSCCALFVNLFSHANRMLQRIVVHLYTHARVYRTHRSLFPTLLWCVDFMRNSVGFHSQVPAIVYAAFLFERRRRQTSRWIYTAQCPMMATVYGMIYFGRQGITCVYQNRHTTWPRLCST